MLTSTKYLGQQRVRQEFGFNMKVMVWFVSYSSKVTRLPAALPGAHKSGKQAAAGERRMVCYHCLCSLRWLTGWQRLEGPERLCSWNCFYMHVIVQDFKKERGRGKIVRGGKREKGRKKNRKEIIT